MEAVALVVLGGLGMLLICLGSVIAIAAPGDGQTGMITFPLWLLGAVLGVIALLGSMLSKVPRGAKYTIWLMALLAIGSVAWAFVVCPGYAPQAK